MASAVNVAVGTAVVLTVSVEVGTGTGIVAIINVEVGIDVVVAVKVKVTSGVSSSVLVTVVRGVAVPVGTELNRTGFGSSSWDNMTSSDLVTKSGAPTLRLPGFPTCEHLMDAEYTLPPSVDTTRSLLPPPLRSTLAFVMCTSVLSANTDS